MQVKRFVAADMRRALELVRQELGPDAIILSSSRTAEGIELLTTMGSDSELLQLQQQPLGKMALASASPMISDDAWSPMVAERDARNHFSAPAIQAPLPNVHANSGKSGRQLADDIEQARARMLANRKAEESAKEFLVGKNTKVNAGIPRYVGSEKQESRYAGAVKQESRSAPPIKADPRFAPSAKEESRYSAPAKQESTRYKDAVADRARSATAVNPLRDKDPSWGREELRPASAKKPHQDSPLAIADRARTATGVNPARQDVRAMGQEFLQQESAFRVEAPAAKKDTPARPASSKVTIPPRRVPVPRPVLVERKPAAVAEKAPAPAIKPKSAMTAAERYPLIDDEPVEIPQPQLRQAEIQTESRQPEVRQPAFNEPEFNRAPTFVVAGEVPAAAAPVARFIITAESDLASAQAQPEVASSELQSEAVAASTTVTEAIPEQAAPAVAASASADAAEWQALHNNKYFLDIQSEIAGMRSLLEQQFNRLQEAAPAVAAPVLVAPVLAASPSPAAVTAVEVVAPVAAAAVPEVSVAVPEISILAPEVSVTAPDVSLLAMEVPEDTLEIPTLMEEVPTLIAEVPTLTAEVVDLSVDKAVGLSTDKAVGLSAEFAGLSLQGSALAATVKEAEEGVVVEESNEQLLELQSEIADMRFALEQQIQQLTEGAEPVTRSSILGAVSRRLERAGLPEDVISKVIGGCRKVASLNEAWPEAMAVLARQLPVVGRDIVDEGGVFAFVGPTGVGKTTTIGKLAARYVLKHGADKVALITTDTYRIASHEQLRSIARILRVPVKVVDENNSLESLLKSLSHCAVVLIDTAGFRHGDPQLKAQLATFSGLPQVKTFVVLSTNCQAQMLKASVHAHGEARLQGCVLTKLDETSSLGEALGVVIKGWLPVAYTTDGQDIPKDLDVARGHQLVAKAIAMIKKNAISAVS